MLNFLLSLILILVVRPFALNTSVEDLIFKIGISIVLFFGIAAISKDKTTLTIGFIASATTVALGLINIFIVNNRFLEIGQLFLTFLVFAYTAVVIIYNMLKQKEVDTETLYAACSGYILIGMLGSLGFMIIQLFDPNSFVLEIGNYGYSKLIYFSFTTLTTLGYGDITPQTPISETFAVILALAGQLYLTLAIAVIVGKYISRRL